MRRLVLLPFVVCFALAVAPSASAATGTAADRSLVVLTGDALVAAGDTVDIVVAFDGAVRIDGSVRQTVVAFHGPVTITGDVGRDVLVFDGRLRVAEGATVRGDVYADDTSIAAGAVGGKVASMTTLAVGFGWASIVLGFLVWLSIAISVLFLGLLLLWVAPRAADSVAAVGRHALGPSIGWGLIVAVGLPVLGVAAAATVIGMPLGLGLLLALALIFAIGQATGAWLLGRRLLPDAARAPAFLLGWAIVAGLALIPFVGGVVWLAASVVGLGASAVAAVRARRAPAPAPAAPVPV